MARPLLHFSWAEDEYILYCAKHGRSAGHCARQLGRKTGSINRRGYMLGVRFKGTAGPLVGHAPGPSSYNSTTGRAAAVKRHEARK